MVRLVFNNSTNVVKALVVWCLCVFVASCSMKADIPVQSLTVDSITVRDSIPVIPTDTAAGGRVLRSGNTISQKLALMVDEEDIEFSISYRVLKDSGSRYWEIDLLTVEQSGGSLLFTDPMLELFRDDFGTFYQIPVNKNYQEWIKPVLTIKDVEHFVMVRDYNLDGVQDIGISIVPTGNNVFEAIYLRLNGQFVHWKKLSGNPVYHEHPDERSVSIVWHMGADSYMTREYKISGDTTLHELWREDQEILNDEKLIRKTYKNGSLIKVDTLPRL